MTTPPTAPLPPEMLAKATEAMSALPRILMSNKEMAEAALQAAGLPALLQELQNIANANPTDWRGDFQAWAQNRARHTLRQVLDADYKEAGCD